MKTFRGVILGICVAISISVFAASLWPNGPWLETFQNGFLFGNGSIFSALNSVPKFDDRRLDDRNKDLYFQEDFEDGTVSFTCGANLTATDETGSPIAGSTSKLITQAAGALNQVCESPTIMLDEKQKDSLNQVCINAIGENFDLIAYDSTNANELGRISIEDTSKTYCLEFLTIASTNAVTYRLEAVNEVVSSTLKYDDVQFKTNPLNAAQVFASTEWEAYSPTITGFGTTSSEDFKYRRLGDTIEVEGYFVSGSSTTTEAQITLPNGYTIKQGALQNVGTWARDVNAGSSELGGFVLATSGDSFINLGDRGTFASSGTNPDAVDAAVGSRVVVSGNGVSLKYSVSVNELSNTFKSIVTNSGDAKTEVYRAYQAAGYGSVNTAIPYFGTELENTSNDLFSIVNNSTDGFKITALKDIEIDFTYNAMFSTVGVGFGITKNSTQLTTAIDSITSSDVVSYASTASSNKGQSISFNGVLKAGDTLRPHTNKNPFNASNVTNSINISARKATLGEYHLVPVSDQENNFSAIVNDSNDGLTSGTNSVSIESQNQPFIETVTNSSTGKYVYTWKAGIFTQKPSITFNWIGATGNTGFYHSVTPSAAGVTIEIFTSTGIPLNRNHSIKVSKQGADYKEPKVFLGNVPVNYTQTKYLGSDQTGAGVDLITFNNLVPGRLYKLDVHVLWVATSDTFQQHELVDGSNATISSIPNQGAGGAGNEWGVHIRTITAPSDGIVKLRTISSMTGAVKGLGDESGTHIVLTELNHTKETSRF